MAGTSEGGKKAAEKIGSEGYSEISKQRSHESRVEGGKKAAEKLGPEHYREIGAKGGSHSHSGTSGSNKNEE